MTRRDRPRLAHARPVRRLGRRIAPPHGSRRDGADDRAHGTRSPEPGRQSRRTRRGIAAALAAADAFTPIGRGTRTDALERKSDVRLGFEIVLAVLLGAAGTVLVVSLGGGGLLSLFGGALLGYAAFMFQNREAYVLERE
ncbi:hypothetical protein [Halospeciosus flavus]|uniref:hypothetical protein n=1 Tax=Halospeciosus flavus TaxID=3032283 RepID=UPI00361BD81C